MLPASLIGRKRDADATDLYIHSLRDSNGQWAGVLFEHSFPHQTQHRNLTCELIAISEGFAYNNDDITPWISELEQEGRPGSRDRYQFFNVMWIEWRKDIAYPKGLGRVVYDTWRELPQEEIMVMLG